MRAIFLDRDGVISENRADHVKSWDEFRFIPGSLPALARLHQAGFPLFIVTNQAIVNRGIITAQILEDMHARMLGHVVQHGGYIDDIRYCPHDYGENCACRKPQPGMLVTLAERWRIDLAASYLIGDAWTDVAAGRSVNCRTIMVRTGRGSEHIRMPETRQHPADLVAADLAAAVEWIFHQEGIEQPEPKSALRSAQLTSIDWSSALQVGG